jgi:hypothetical protein
MQWRYHQYSLLSLGSCFPLYLSFLATDAPLMVPQMLCSLDFSRAKTKQIVIAGNPEVSLS